MSLASRTAVVLAGGVAKGAFEAGALDVLIERTANLTHVVGASSGALNATLLAAGVRAGRARDATRRLIELWRDEASWSGFFNLSWRDLLERTGISDSQDVLALLQREVPRIATAARDPVRLRIVVAALDGVVRNVGGEPETTFEGVQSFADGDFDDEAGRARIYTAAAASAAFPLLFHPVDVPVLGPCYDGGAVNNTPIQLAVQDGLDEVIVITPYPARFSTPKELKGVDLVSRLIEILIQERVYRDLSIAEATNAQLERLRALATVGTLDAAQLAAVLRAVDARPIRIVLVRPDEELPGNAFAGFWRRELREQYIAAGQAAARAVAL